MTIPITGSGAIFPRLGHLFCGIDDALSVAGGAVSPNVESAGNMATRAITVIGPDYAAGTPLPQVIQSLLTSLTSYQASTSSITQPLQQMALNTLLAMANIDSNGANDLGTLQQLTTGFTPQQALQLLVSQMTANSDTVQAATVTAGSQTSVGSPNGNPTIVLSLKTPTGLLYQLCYPETLRFICIVDSQTGGAIPGNETVNVSGQAAVSNTLSPYWPGGSNCNVNVNAVTAGTSASANNNSAGNAFYNGSFLTYSTANCPDNWTALVGSIGTQILNGSGTSYLSGGGSVEFVGDSSTLTSLCQAFAATPTTTLGMGGTNATLQPNTVYHGVVFYKLSSSSPAAGVLALDLVNASNTVVADSSSTNNSVSVTLSGVSNTNWHPLTFAFRTPAILPSQLKFRMHLTTALTTGTNVYLSDPTWTTPTSLYNGGPWCSVHAGSSILIDGLSPDTFTIAIGNNYSTSGDGLMQQFFQRCFNLLGISPYIQLPYAASSPTVNDDLIA